MTNDLNLYSSLMQVMAERYSCRDYDTRRAPGRDLIDAVLDAARIAPSACNRQPWRFMVVEGEHARSIISRAYDRAWIATAPAFIIALVLGKVEREHEKRRRAELCQSRAEELYAHVKDLESVNLKIRGMKHDLKHYTADIQALLLKIESGDMWAKEELRHYVDSMHLSLERLDSKCQTNHPVTDVIIGRYERLMEQKQISFSCDFIYPKQFGIDVFDLSVILNNGLENALEACEREPGKAKASILSKQKGNMFFITIENTCSKRMRWGEEFPISEKRENGHGLGLKNIKDCAERYFGRVCVQILDNRFILTVMLQGQSVP